MKTQCKHVMMHVMMPPLQSVLIAFQNGKGDLLTSSTDFLGERFFPGGYFVGRTPFSGEDSSPNPSFPTAPRRIKTAISLRSLGAPALEPPKAPHEFLPFRTRPILRHFVSSDSSTTKQGAFRRRTGLDEPVCFRGAAPRAVKGTQVSLRCNPGSRP
jgi:hypothetical protein